MKKPEPNTEVLWHGLETITEGYIAAADYYSPLASDAHGRPRKQKNGEITRVDRTDSGWLLEVDASKGRGETPPDFRVEIGKTVDETAIESIESGRSLGTLLSLDVGESFGALTNQKIWMIHGTGPDDAVEYATVFVNHPNNDRRLEWYRQTPS